MTPHFNQQNFYAWIQAANGQRLLSQKPDFLAECCPGSGKTTFGSLAGWQDLNASEAEFVIVLSPSARVNEQWINRFYDPFGVEMIGSRKHPWRPDPKFGFQVPRGYNGAVLTYHAMDRHFVELEKFIRRVPTLVIFDEIHHLGIQASWGDHALASFAHAKKRIQLSGTPFRGNRTSPKIPFIPYETRNGAEISKADFVYTYAEAIRDKICRGMSFPDFTGTVEGKYGNAEDGWEKFAYDFKDQLDDAEARIRLRAAVDPASDFVHQMLEDANETLSFVRDGGHSDAGGLVIAHGQQAARDIAEHMEESLGESPSLIISDDGEQAKKEIDLFANSHHRWAVSVNMITEGVDIPRLRVGVYATNITSLLRFLQINGRFNRYLRGTNFNNDMSWLHMPKDPILYSMAQEILKQQAVGLYQKKEGQTKEGGNGGGSGPCQIHLTDSLSNHDETTVATVGGQSGPGVSKWTAHEIAWAKQAVAKGGHNIAPEAFLATYVALGNSVPTPNTHPVVSPVIKIKPTTGGPRAMASDKMRERCGKLVRKLVVAKHGTPGSNINDWKKWCLEIEMEWQNKGNPPVKSSTLEDLRRKADWLKGKMDAL